MASSAATSALRSRPLAAVIIARMLRQLTCIRVSTVPSTLFSVAMTSALASAASPFQVSAAASEASAAARAIRAWELRSAALTGTSAITSSAQRRAVATSHLIRAMAPWMPRISGFNSTKSESAPDDPIKLSARARASCASSIRPLLPRT